MDRELLLEIGTEEIPASWLPGLTERGHRTTSGPSWDSGFGHAHAIVVEPTGVFAGAADPRTVIGSTAGG